jgi:(p)ppGpp synthase/HD superfamily hydrolase
VDDAVKLVLEDFRAITRKDRETPYIAHLFAVAATVAEAGGSEDQIVAALLHDWLEDIETAREEVLEARFGPEVCRIVVALTDSTTFPKPAWRPRKEAFLERLVDLPPDVKLVAAADKLNNVESIVRDLQLDGPKTFDRFSGGVGGTLWYYEKVAEAVRIGWQHAWLLDALSNEVARMFVLSGVAPGTARPT